MQTCRLLRRQLVWIALWAMCFGAIAPTVSRWLAAHDGAFAADICSAHGSGAAGLAGGSDPAQKSPSIVGDDCAYCVLAHHLPVTLPPAATAPAFAVAAGPVRIDVPGATTLPRSVARSHPPRAPPFFG